MQYVSMGQVHFWSSIICSACILLTTFARHSGIPATPTESAMGEIGSLPQQKVPKRIYRDGPVRLVASESTPVNDSATVANTSADTTAAVASAAASTAAAAPASAAASSAAAATVTGTLGKDDIDLKVLPAEKPTRITSESTQVTDSTAAAAADAAATQSSVSLSSSAPNALYSNAQLDYQGCSMNPCKNAGVCKLQPFGANKIFCRCLPGFFGGFCQYDAPECQMDPCLHNGQCRRSLTEPRGYECHCADGYEGDNCETMVTTHAEAVLRAGVTDASDQLVAPAAASPSTPTTTTTTTTSFFLKLPFLAMVAVSFLMLALSFFATIDAERKIVIERYAVLTAHGYILEYPKAGYLRLAMRKFFFLTCLCCSVFPCLDNYFVQQAEEQTPLSLLLKTGQHKGYAPLPHSGDRGSSPASAAFPQTPSVAGR